MQVKQGHPEIPGILSQGGGFPLNPRGAPPPRSTQNLMNTPLVPEARWRIFGFYGFRFWHSDRPRGSTDWPIDQRPTQKCARVMVNPAGAGRLGLGEYRWRLCGTSGPGASERRPRARLANPQPVREDIHHPQRDLGPSGGKSWEHFSPNSACTMGFWRTIREQLKITKFDGRG